MLFRITLIFFYYDTSENNENQVIVIEASNENKINPKEANNNTNINLDINFNSK